MIVVSGTLARYPEPPEGGGHDDPRYPVSRQSPYASAWQPGQPGQPRPEDARIFLLAALPSTPYWARQYTRWFMEDCRGAAGQAAETAELLAALRHLQLSPAVITSQHAPVISRHTRRNLTRNSRSLRGKITYPRTPSNAGPDYLWASPAGASDLQLSQGGSTAVLRLITSST